MPQKQLRVEKEGRVWWSDRASDEGIVWERQNCEEKYKSPSGKNEFYNCSQLYLLRILDNNVFHHYLHCRTERVTLIYIADGFFIKDTVYESMQLVKTENAGVFLELELYFKGHFILYFEWVHNLPMWI